MGETAADTQREIEEIRKDILSATRELNNRVTHAVSPRTYVDLARDNPAAVVGLGLAGLGLVGAAAARAVFEQRRRNRPSERLRRTVQGVAEGLGDQLSRAREALPVGISLTTSDQQADQATQLQMTGSGPSVFKRIMWAALVAGMMAAGGLLARRISAAIWRQAMREDPPSASV